MNESNTSITEKPVTYKVIRKSDGQLIDYTTLSPEKWCLYYMYTPEFYTFEELPQRRGK